MKSNFYYRAETITTYRLKSSLVEDFLLRKDRGWIEEYNKYCEERKKKWEDRVYKNIPERHFNFENWLKLTKSLRLSVNTKVIVICYRQTNHPVLYLKFKKDESAIHSSQI